jgi:hypothetical protein
MSLLHRVRLFAAIGLLPLFAACGGGGTDEAPAAQNQGPGPNPTTPPSQAITISTSPTPQLYASLGSSTTSAGDGYTPVAQDARLTDVSLEAVNQPMLRYAAAGHYEIQLPGSGFTRLVHYAGLVNPTPDSNFFQPAGVVQNQATFTISLSRLNGYQHSELASWTDGTATALDRLGYVAFGTVAPSAAIPDSGSATYRGSVYGLVDVTAFDYLYGGWYFSTATGTVTLTVDFTARSITGTIEVSVDDGTTSTTVPFSATTVLPGEDTWRGSFETAQSSGFNEFKARLTGPDASELIGSWAIPMVVNGAPHQLIGAWIAARD